MSHSARPSFKLSPKKRALLEALLQEEGVAPSKTQRISPRTTDDLPLSYAQQRLWFFDQSEPGSPVYNVPKALRFVGTLNLDALQQALDAIVARHESLRTTFVSIDGHPKQIIAEQRTVEMRIIDLDHLPEVDRESRLRRLLREEIRRPFDLSQDLMLRAALFRLKPTEHVLLLVMHHIASDGWSSSILSRELTALYRAFCVGEPSPLPDLPVQYADFALWQRRQLRGEKLAGQLAYWRRQLSGISALDLPTDRPRPLQQTYSGSVQSVILSPRLAESIKELGRREGVTLFMTLLTTFQILLHRYTGQGDIAVGSPIAGRNQPEIEGLIGFFVNTLVLRADLSGNPTFRELLQRVRESCLEAYAHQDLPFEKLVEELKPPRALTRHPLFQVMLVLQNAPGEAPALSDLTLNPLDVDNETALFDLTLSVTEEAGGLNGSLYYNTDLFDAATIRRMLGHFQTLLESIVADPDRPIGALPMLTDPEHEQLIYEWNRPQRETAVDGCAHHLFERQAESTPDRIAVVHGEQNLTYSALNQRSNQLARYLMRNGVGPETLVAVCLDRSPELVIAVLAILKAGGAFIVLDVNDPIERLEYIWRDAGSAMVITDAAFATQLTNTNAKTIRIDAEWSRIAEETAENPMRPVETGNLAYAVYTSGTTGRPKGILVSHESLVNYTMAIKDIYDLSPADRRLQFAALGSDMFVSDIFSYLLSGGAIVFRPEPGFASIAEFLRFISEHRITSVGLPSAYWHEWVASMSDGATALPSALRLVMTGMDKVRPELFALWKQKVGHRIRWFNVYGPSEATCAATIFEPNLMTLGEFLSVPIGRPIANAKIYLLDRYQNPTPIGVPGELYIGGPGVARGYLNRPGLTAERFLSDPFSHEPNARLYRTGDLARYRPDGQIEFLGRIDDQVKIRGYRVEPGEIEAVLREHPAVQEAAVIARENPPSAIRHPQSRERRLVAYVVSSPASSPSIADWRGFLKQRLPGHMIPSAFVMLDSLPLTPSGKVDRRALPIPDDRHWEPEETFVAPRTPLESLIAEVWQEALGIDRIAVYDNFFDLGGHSLLSVEVVARLEKKLGLRINPRELVFQTLGQLASSCDERMQLLQQSDRTGFAQNLWHAVKRTIRLGQDRHP